MNREDVLTEFLTAWERRLAAHRAQLRAEAERLAAGFARAGAQRVLLFGSTACGRAGFVSDLDLVVAPADPEHDARAFPFPGAAGRGSSGRWSPGCLPGLFSGSLRLHVAFHGIQRGVPNATHVIRTVPKVWFPVEIPKMIREPVSHTAG